MPQVPNQLSQHPRVLLLLVFERKGYFPPYKKLLKVRKNFHKKKLCRLNSTSCSASPGFTFFFLISHTHSSSSFLTGCRESWSLRHSRSYFHPCHNFFFSSWCFCHTHPSPNR